MIVITPTAIIMNPMTSVALLFKSKSKCMAISAVDIMRRAGPNDTAWRM